MSERNNLKDIEAMIKLTILPWDEIYGKMPLSVIVLITFANDISEEAIAKYGDEQKKTPKDFMKSLKKCMKNFTSCEKVGLTKKHAERVDF